MFGIWREWGKSCRTLPLTCSIFCYLQVDKVQTWAELGWIVGHPAGVQSIACWCGNRPPPTHLPTHTLEWGLETQKDLQLKGCPEARAEEYPDTFLSSPKSRPYEQGPNTGMSSLSFLLSSTFIFLWIKISSSHNNQHWKYLDILWENQDPTFVWSLSMGPNSQYNSSPTLGQEISIWGGQ